MTARSDRAHDPCAYFIGWKVNKDQPTFIMNEKITARRWCSEKNTAWSLVATDLTKEAGYNLSDQSSNIVISPTPSLLLDFTQTMTSPTQLHSAPLWQLDSPPSHLHSPPLQLHSPPLQLHSTPSQLHSPRRTGTHQGTIKFTSAQVLWFGYNYSHWNKVSFSSR